MHEMQLQPRAASAPEAGGDKDGAGAGRADGQERLQHVVRPRGAHVKHLGAHRGGSLAIL